MPFCTLQLPYKSLLEYGVVVWYPYTMSNTQKLDRVQNHFLSFAGHSLTIAHPPHDYIVKLKICLNSSHSLNVALIVVALFDHWLMVSSTHLVYWNDWAFASLVITVIKILLLPVGRRNFTKNAPLTRIMSIFNKNQ